MFWVLVLVLPCKVLVLVLVFESLVLVLGPLYISGMVKATNLKFGVQIDYNEYYSNMQN